MTKHKIHILGIAPYEGMKSLMQKVAREREDVTLDVYVGDLEEGASIARQHMNEDYDAIVSRGGTAELIREFSLLPVVDASLSVYDILRAIKLSQNYGNRYAIVGFSGITSSAHILCDLLQYDIDIFTVRSQSEVEETLNDLKRQGYQMVLCDMIASTLARHIGLNALLITSGAESISTAFDQAILLTQTTSRLQEENRMLRFIREGGSEYVLLATEDGTITRSTFDIEAFPDIPDIIREEIPGVLEKGTRKFFKNLNGTLYSFVCRRVNYQQKDHGVFYFSSTSVPFAKSKYGIKYATRQEVEDSFFNSFYSLLLPESHVDRMFGNLDPEGVPVMLSGEPGSGKEQAAKNIYSQSPNNRNSMITVNCSLLNDRSWNFLTNHYNSPFNDNDNTIYIKDFVSLSGSKRQQLLSLLIDTNVCKRNFVIFSCDCKQGQKLPPEAMEYVNMLSCVTIHLSPLRDHTDEIPTLASLWLNKLNLSMTNQIIGFEPDAMRRLQEYSWPYNYTQFKRILQELALVTTTPYIHAEDVAALLEKEPGGESPSGGRGSSTYGGGQAAQSLDLTKPLSEITRDVIQLVLDETNGNQSAAAKRLGIGRSTLWRYLKE